MRTIGPGQSLVYQFQATHSGIWMYHCGTPPVLHHVGNGMYGAVIIDPPDLPAVDHEYIFVQSELYLGGTTEAGYMKMQNEQWDAVVFNGYVNQYSAAPIRVEPGQTIRAWVLDAGPSESSSFHVIGTIFDTVYREGHYELRPDATHGGSQALDLQPAQGGFVEFTLEKPGTYPFITHKLADVCKGALGLFQAGEPSPDASGGARRPLTELARRCEQSPATEDLRMIASSNTSPGTSEGDCSLNSTQLATIRRLLEADRDTVPARASVFVDENGQIDSTSATHGQGETGPTDVARAATQGVPVNASSRSPRRAFASIVKVETARASKAAVIRGNRRRRAHRCRRARQCPERRHYATATCFAR